MKNLLKSSEFWTTLVGTVITITVLSGKLTPAQGSEISELITNIAGAVITLLATLGIVKTNTAKKRDVFEAKVAALLDTAGRVSDGTMSMSSVVSGIDKAAQDL